MVDFYTNSELVHTILGSFQRRRVSTTQNMRIGKTNSQTTKVVTTYSIIPRFLQWSINLYRQCGNSPSYGLQMTPVLPQDTVWDFMWSLVGMGYSPDQQAQMLNQFLETNKVGSNLDCLVRDENGFIEPLCDTLLRSSHNKATCGSPLDGIALVTTSQASHLRQSFAGR